MFAYIVVTNDEKFAIYKTCGNILDVNVNARPAYGLPRTRFTIDIEFVFGDEGLDTGDKAFFDTYDEALAHARKCISTCREEYMAEITEMNETASQLSDKIIKISIEIKRLQYENGDTGS